MVFYRNKYRAKKKVCASGHKHDSTGEADYCDKLKMLKENRKIKDYKTQVSYNLAVNGIHICRHVVDFEVYFFNKPMEVHEYKGYETSLWKIKAKLFKVMYPKIPYIVVKGR